MNPPTTTGLEIAMIAIFLLTVMMTGVLYFRWRRKTGPSRETTLLIAALITATSVLQNAYDDPVPGDAPSRVGSILLVLAFPIWVAFLDVAGTASRREGYSFWKGRMTSADTENGSDRLIVPVVAGLVCALYACASGAFPNYPMETAPHMRDILDGQATALFLSPIRVIKFDLLFCAVLPAIGKRLVGNRAWSWPVTVFACAAVRAIPIHAPYGFAPVAMLFQSVPIGVVLIVVARRHGAVAMIAAALLERGIALALFGLA